MKATLLPTLLFLFAAIATSGCDGGASTTDDSTKLEMEVPKVEVGNAPMDLDPSTDDDVDVDTPLKGDS